MLVAFVTPQSEKGRHFHTGNFIHNQKIIQISDFTTHHCPAAACLTASAYLELIHTKTVLPASVVISDFYYLFSRRLSRVFLPTASLRPFSCSSRSAHSNNRINHTKMQYMVFQVIATAWPIISTAGSAFPGKFRYNFSSWCILKGSWYQNHVASQFRYQQPYLTELCNNGRLIGP